MKQIVTQLPVEQGCGELRGFYESEWQIRSPHHMSEPVQNPDICHPGMVHMDTKPDAKRMEWSGAERGKRTPGTGRQYAMLAGLLFSCLSTR